MGSDQFAEFSSAPDAIDKLDLDALLAIVRQRTPGEWEVGGPYPTTTVIVCVDGGQGWPEPEPPAFECVALIDRRIEGDPHPQAQADSAAIVIAVNNFEPLIALCKQLTRQRDALLAALEEINCMSSPLVATSVREVIKKAQAGMKGGADGH